jgi:hypothetical protein
MLQPHSHPSSAGDYDARCVELGLSCTTRARALLVRHPCEPTKRQTSQSHATPERRHTLRSQPCLLAPFSRAYPLPRLDRVVHVAMQSILSIAPISSLREGPSRVPRFTLAFCSRGCSRFSSSRASTVLLSDPPPGVRFRISKQAMAALAFRTPFKQSARATVTPLAQPQVSSIPACSCPSLSSSEWGGAEDKQRERDRARENIVQPPYRTQGVYLQQFDVDISASSLSSPSGRN